jgi:predicted GIY-YIG superfamily endonuclease
MDDCWYVGVTKNGKVNQRLANHLGYGASGWTKTHKAISVYTVVAGDHEEALTRQLIAQYGEDKVRGHHFVQVENPSWTGLVSSIHGCVSNANPADLSLTEITSLFT